MEPIENLEWRNVDDLSANDWNPNTVFGPEARLLERNLLRYGWLQPILINSDNVIVDGFHRWSIAKSGPVRKKWGGRVPCVVVELDTASQMVLTVAMNRAKGEHTAARMSELVRRLVEDHGFDVQDLAVQIGASEEEVRRLLVADLWKERSLEGAPYSQAWVPRAKPTTA